MPHVDGARAARRTAIVCGASSGLGLATAEALAEEGANVAMFARRREELEREADRLGALAVPATSRTRRDLERLVERRSKPSAASTSRLGRRRPAGRPGVGISDDALEAAFELSSLPAVRLVRLCLPHLERAPRDAIVCISSSAAKEPTPNLALSNALRPGVTGWAKSLAHELGPKGITVNCVAPGRIDTPRMTELYGPDGPPPAELERIPLGRLGTPREFGDVVCFLASDRAAYVTGATVLVDGGISRGLLEASAPRAPVRRSGWCCSRSSPALWVVPVERVHLPARLGAPRGAARVGAGGQIRRRRRRSTTST